MATNAPNEKMEQLFRYYAKNLPHKVELIRDKWVILTTKNWDESLFMELLEQVHVLCGSTRIYGFITTTNILDELETFLQRYLHQKPTQEDKVVVDKILTDITHSIEISQNVGHLPVHHESLNFRRILTVDDDKTMTEIIATYVQTEEHVVYKASSAEEALQLFDTYNPDIVLTDLYMPGMDGIELLKKLKEKAPQCIVIVISGAGKLDDAVSALRLGAWDYVIKPFTKTMIDRALFRAFEHLRLTEEVKRSRLQLECNNIRLTESLEKLREDQIAGRTVQEQLQPKSNSQFKQYSISHKVIPSLYLSGDFADYFEITPEKLGFYVADVSGHGASSAFVTVLLRGLIDKMQEKYRENGTTTILDPKSVLKSVSDSILEANLGKYITMVYCILDLKNNVLTYSVGGHYPNPMVFDGKNVYFLDGKGFPVGVHAKSIYENCSFPISDECTIGMFTDGILELLGSKDLKDKEKELLTIFQSSHQDIPALLKNLNIDDQTQFPEDITLLLISRNR
jgi:phosphoserine phosphatase RsbU/P